MRNENTYIRNLKGASIYKNIIENKEITSKAFISTLPYSLEVIRINDTFHGSIYKDNNKQYTNDLVNVTFDGEYWIKNEETGKYKPCEDKENIRKYLYENGFDIDGVKYIFYKRTASKAKEGDALFINEKMKGQLINKSRLSLKFEDNDEMVDITSLLAYESLILSGIENVIELDPKKEILIIDDIEGKGFDVNASVTTEENRKLKTENKDISLYNCLTDGQGLLDESVFKKYNKIDKGFMLLRNDFFKCCAFNTKLQEWFEYNKFEVGEIIYDKYDNPYNIKDIKLVITPNSLKFLKFSNKFKTEEECCRHWFYNIDNTFGVVKYDKQGNFGNYNRTTYQLINSIPNITTEDLTELVKEEKDYVMLLKNDFNVFKEYVLKDEGEGYKSFNTIQLLIYLNMINSDIQYTDEYIRKKDDAIGCYIQNLKKGKIRIKDTKYVTLFSNPYEMLLKTVKKYNTKSIMVGREVYCPYYKEGQEFCASRNPHINAGNVMYTINKYHEEYKWFNLTDHICTINFFDNDAPDRLQGCDTDSDTMLITTNDILIEKAKYCEKEFKTPKKDINGMSEPKKYNMFEISKLDHFLANNSIGEIVNLSQIINSYMNEAIILGKDKEEINELYNLSSRLSSLSQIEIDKSKKNFHNVDVKRELGKIKRSKYIKHIEKTIKYEVKKETKKKKVKKTFVPMFFKNIVANKKYEFREFKTPMDELIKVLDDIKNAKRKSCKKKFEDLLVQQKDLGVKYQQKQVEKICGIITDYKKKFDAIHSYKEGNRNKDRSEKDRLKIRLAFEEARDKIKKIKVNTATVLTIIKRGFNTRKGVKIKVSKDQFITILLLYASHKDKVEECFIKNNIEVENKVEYEIFGEKF
ncbi:MAG TPA: hypothetical protein DEP72_03810 [Clostridiales bacterium]|nr:MAG: hypothetical protein A2Y18_05260 [Clostridiales bacterium GWD2_32_19]HCC07280.1 hypothetical protein [Clostridiales bacterium]